MSEFKYEIGDIVGTYEILAHWRESKINNGPSKKNNVRTYYKCRCIKCGAILEKTRQDQVDSFVSRIQCQNCRHINVNNFRYEIGDKINDRLVIIDKFRKGGLRYYEYQCQKDEYIGIVTEQNILNRKMICPVCTHCKLVPGLNDFNTLYPEYAEFLVNHDEGNTIGVGESYYADFICPHCGEKLTHINIRSVIRLGYIPCYHCGKKTSNAEKITLVILSCNHIEFNFQKTFKEWAPNYRYDFYLPSDNCIIETNGKQHYEEVEIFKNTLAEQQVIDKEKEKLALSQGFNFLAIDCRAKNLRALCQNIIEALSTIVVLTNTDIDALMHEFRRYQFYEKTQ